jgi:16S rRNA (adenine1518-N6/adenine1519-N6)-dimethyltransferase
MKFAKKSLGQNFLIDKNIINKIINLVTIRNKDIIEIGPGRGALTEEIIKKKPKSLSLIEKDFFLAENLKKKYSNFNNIKVYNSDVLKFDIEKITTKNTIIFGNLPYNISSQILVKFLKFKKWPPKFNDLIFMFQKELGKKIIGVYPSSDYGRIAILSNFRLNVLNKFYVSPNCFFPKPKVTSMVLHFRAKKKNSFTIKNISNLEKVTNILFSNKRKMINKNIKKILTENKINDIQDLKLNLRPSDINPEVYYKITELYEKK